MEAFPYQQHHPYLLDSLYIPNSPNIEMALPPHQVGEMSNASSSCFTGCYYPSEPIPEASTTDNLSSDSTKDSKRKQGDGSCLSSGQSKGTKETKSRRKKKGNGGLKGPEQEEEKKPKADKMENSKASENPPSGYIHVRARRGQATDSHSLAERVRRERISERMKKLQGLVPGCDKVIGKALVLDEIINYVQSLQNQVEFLSMKLASVNPILYELGVGFDDFMNQPEEMGIMSQPIPSVIQASRIPPTAFEGATSNSSVIDSLSASSLHGQGPANVFSQNNGSFLMQVGDHRRGFTNQVQLHNPCSFQ